MSEFVVATIVTSWHLTSIGITKIPIVGCVVDRVVATTSLPPLLHFDLAHPLYDMLTFVFLGHIAQPSVWHFSALVVQWSCETRCKFCHTHIQCRCGN